MADGELKPKVVEVEVEMGVKRQAGTPVWLVVGIAAIFSVASSFATLQISKREMDKSKSPVVMLDSASIALAKSKALFMAHEEGADPRESAKRFVVDMNNVIQEYTSHGIVVINSAAVLNKPAGMDITKEVATKLGVSMQDVDAIKNSGK